MPRVDRMWHCGQGGELTLTRQDARTQTVEAQGAALQSVVCKTAASVSPQRAQQGVRERKRTTLAHFLQYLALVVASVIWAVEVKHAAQLRGVCWDVLVLASDGWK